MPIMTATPDAIASAAEKIRAGKLVAFPTETVYGIGADATNAAAVADIFAAKGRPHFNPLIVHVADLEAAQKLAKIPGHAECLAELFWPGPLTMVLQQQPDNTIPELTTAGLATVAIRIPDHPVAQALLRQAGCPIAAPSANRSGHVSATHANHVSEDLGKHVAMILEGGPTEHGLESTVIDATTADLIMLRHGAITAEAIKSATGHAPTSHVSVAAPTSPGQLLSHYAPNRPLRLNVTDVKDGEALLAFGPDGPPTSGLCINLSPAGDLREAAANLFAALRTLDRDDVGAIAVMAIPDHDLGQAINDRLRRAAAPRATCF